MRGLQIGRAVQGPYRAPRLWPQTPTGNLGDNDHGDSRPARGRLRTSGAVTTLTARCLHRPIDSSHPPILWIVATVKPCSIAARLDHFGRDLDVFDFFCGTHGPLLSEGSHALESLRLPGAPAQSNAPLRRHPITLVRGEVRPLTSWDARSGLSLAPERAPCVASPSGGGSA